MTLIGMFHNRNNPEKVSRAYSYASAAKMEGVDFFYFSSKRVNLSKSVINGLYYENGKWIEKEFPFPDVIINAVKPITLKQSEIYNELKKIIPFTSYPVGSKLSVYNRIKKGKMFENYLIPYKKINKHIDVLMFLDIYPQIILKPIRGKHGNQVIFIEKKDDNFLTIENDKSQTMTKIELFDYITQLLKNNKMLMQKYISSKKNTGEPSDIRLHVQKDGEGIWRNTILYPKIGFKSKVTTNLGQGGQITILKKFLINEYGIEYYDIQRYLEIFSLQFAKHFDTLYKHSFDELGIDVGIDDNKKIWIYEVNWRPGHMFIESKTAKNAVLYACYIAKKRSFINESIKSESNFNS